MKCENGILYVIIVIITIACAENNLVKKDSTVLIEEENIKADLYKKWIGENNNYDLEGIIEEEKRNIQKRSSIVKTKKDKGGKKVYVHYMPWFESEEKDGFWGQHWTMTNKDPNFIDRDGKREIASHYYPLIGPYSTKDKDLQQYHLLLMKLAGVDGVIFDWYGKRDVLDFKHIRTGMESFIKELNKTNLEFAVMYEDRVIKEQGIILSDIQIGQAREDIRYIEKRYMSNKRYIRIKRAPLLMIFGPSYIDSSNDWNLILDSLRNRVSLLTLWNSGDILGENNFSGEYAWIDKGHLETLSNYYSGGINYDENIVGGISYPRFHDFYFEGGWKSEEEEGWEIEDNGLQTFRESYEESLKYPNNFMQIATWNDFGEGTQIEPTNEFGFTHLELLQEYTKTKFSKEDLRIPYYIYKLRKKHSNNYKVKFLMNIAYWYAMHNNTSRAKFMIGLTMFYFGDDF